ncbi:MAG: hypothetical protein NVV70_06415 [Cellulomonas sp.]|nr:hypothetical protein [Cellulomonas sp.]MCR6647777.1 hypothetical protein [Cellulomonas sp.]
MTDPSVPYAVLIEGARADLPDVALRHGVKVIRAAHAAVIDGRRVPGSGGAQYVVVIEASVVRLRDLPETLSRTAKARAS